MITGLVPNGPGRLTQGSGISRAAGGEVEAGFCGSWRDNGSYPAEMFDSGKKYLWAAERSVGPGDSGVGPLVLAGVPGWNCQEGSRTRCITSSDRLRQHRGAERQRAVKWDGILHLRLNMAHAGDLVLRFLVSVHLISKGIPESRPQRRVESSRSASRLVMLRGDRQPARNYGQILERRVAILRRSATIIPRSPSSQAPAPRPPDPPALQSSRRSGRISRPVFERCQDFPGPGRTTLGRKLGLRSLVLIGTMWALYYGPVSPVIHLVISIPWTWRWPHVL